MWYPVVDGGEVSRGDFTTPRSLKDCITPGVTLRPLCPKTVPQFYSQEPEAPPPSTGLKPERSQDSFFVGRDRMSPTQSLATIREMITKETWTVFFLQVAK